MKIFYLIPLGLFVVTILGYLGNLWVPFDLFSHFRLQYVVLLLLCLLFFILKQNKLWGIVSLLFLLLNIYEISPVYLNPKSTQLTQKNDSETLRLLNINIEYSNRNSEAVLKEIERVDADVLVLVEYTEWWKNALNSLNAKYPFQESVIQTTNDFGLCVYSRFPLSPKQIHRFNNIDTPTLETDINFNGEEITLFAFHPPAPVSKVFGFWGRDKVYSEFIPYLQKNTSQSTLVVGDFNASPFSYIFKKMLKETQLKNTQNGFGWQGSFPRKMYPVHISIDHCLMSDDFICTKRKTGNITDSDHLPVYLELQMK